MKNAKLLGFQIIKTIKTSLFESFSYLLLSQVVFSVCSFVIGVFCSRYYGPTIMGGYNYVVSFTALFSSLLVLGLDGVAIKELSQSDNKEEVFGSLLVTFLIGQSVAIFLCLLIGVQIGLDGTKFLFCILLCMPWLVNYLNIYKQYLISQSTLKSYSILYSSASCLFLFIKVFIIIRGKSIVVFAILTCIESLCALLYMYIGFLIEKLEKIRFVVNWDKIIRYIRIGIPFTISSLAVSIYMKIDQLMVGGMLGDYELGIYSLTVSLSECWYIIPTALYNAMLPRLSKAYADNKDIDEKMQQLADYLAIIGYAAIVGVIVFGKLLVPILYGKEYARVGNLMIVYVIAGFFVCIGFLFSAFFAIKEKSVYSMVRTLIGCVINIALNWILIKQIGSMGAVVATVITQFMTGIVINALVGIRDKELGNLVIIELKSFFPFNRLIENIK